MPSFVDLDPIYFADEPWSERFKHWLEQHATDEAFAGANATVWIPRTSYVLRQLRFRTFSDNPSSAINHSARLPHSTR
jgi:hypothetical protein